MSQATATLVEPGLCEATAQPRSKFRDYVELTKPRISVMVLFTVAAAGYAASTLGQVAGWQILHAVVGTFLVAASGSAFNQYLERWLDARMKRTSRRPLPAGRLTSMEVARFATVTFCSGIVYLWLTAGPLPAVLGLATWVLYVWIYTPMKRWTSWNTLVGAIAGALPILIGWFAATHRPGWLGFSMFGVLVLWQFPHFMAIAWKYRFDYAEGGMRMLTVADPTGRAAGLAAVVGAVLILPVSLIPAWVLAAPPLWFLAITVLAGVAYLWLSCRFLADVNEQTARRLLRGSLLYLPLYFAALMLAL